MKKVTKRILSIVLALTMLSTILTVVANAATTDTVKQYGKYVSLGDSVGSGFGLPDYKEKVGDGIIYTGGRIEGCYADLVAKYTGADLQMMNYPGYTTAALRYELDDDYEMTEWEEFEMANFTYGYYSIDKMKELRPTFKKAVQSADLITLDIGLNDTWFTTIALIYYIADQGSIGPFDPRGTLKEQLDKYGSWGLVLRNAAYFVAGWAENPLQWGHFISLWLQNATMYLTTFQENWKAIVESIYELNPDVTIVALGSYNAFANWELVPGVNGYYTIKTLDDGPAKVEIPLIGEYILPDEITIYPTFACVPQLMYDLTYNSARKYYTKVYPEQYYYCDVKDTELITENWTVPLYEFMSVDDSGFNPHPTLEGSKYMANQIISVLPEDGSKFRTLTKGASGWGVYNSDGSVDTTYSGLAQTSKNVYYVRKGLLAKDYSGIIKFRGTKYYIKNGKWMQTYSGTVTTKTKVYTIKDGIVTKEASR